MNAITPAIRRKLVSRLNRDAVLLEDRHPQDARECETLAARIAPRAKIKKPMQRHREQMEKEDHAEENAETARIRGACMARSGGFCECGCGRRLREGGFLLAPEMDEWLNGNGRRTQKRAISTCWILASVCHGQRQRYSPSVAHWNEKRRAHDEKHLYQHVPHIEHQQLKTKRTA